MFLHDDVGVQVIQGAIGLCAIGPGTVVKTFDLIVPPPRPLSDRRSWKRDKGVGLVRVRRRGRILVLTQRLGRNVWGHRRMWGQGLNVNGGIDSACGTCGRSRAVIGRIREGVVVGLLRAIIGRGGVAVGPGVGGIGGTRGSGVVDGWRRVGGRVAVVTRVQGTISRWMGAAEEGGLGHPTMVDGGIWGRIERRGRAVPLV
jgi:hypothetical protein